MRTTTVACAPESRSQTRYRKLLLLLNWPARFLQARHDLAQLAHLSDYQLKDMGVTRMDVANAAALPLTKDPTEYLAQIRSERRKDGVRRHNENESGWLKRPNA